MSKYTVLINASVQNANAFQGYFIGIGTPNTAISFVEYVKLNILKNIKESGFNGFENYNVDLPFNSFDFINVENVIYGYDGLTFTLHKGHEKFVGATKGDFSINTPIVDNRTYSSDFFLLFTLDFKNEISNFDISILKEIVFNIVNSSNFSGGKIFNVFKRNINIIAQRELFEEYTDIAGFLKNKLNRSNHSWFLIEQFSKSYLEEFNSLEDFKNLNELDKLLYIIKKEKYNKKIKNDKDYHSTFNGYYIPMTLGYRFLEDLKEPSENFKFKNAYSEPLLGIVRCRSLDSFLNNPIHEIVWNNELKKDCIISTAKKIN